MSIISPADLEASPLADLHALASALAIDGFRRLRKDELIDAILARQGAAAPKRARRTRAAAAAEPEPQAEAAAESDDALEEGSEERPARSRRSRRGGRGRSRDGAAEDASSVREEADSPPGERLAEGVVELLGNGSGFLRVNAGEVSDDDVYISAAQARRCELVAGDRISGPIRPARRSERHPSLIRIDTINGVPAEEAVVGTRIDEIDVDFPTVAFALGEELDALPPFGRGSRVLIAGPPRSGRTALLQKVAAALGAVEDIDVELVAVGVRPEELTEYKALEHATSTGLSFAASADAQESAVEQAAERGRRIALRGGDAALLIDTLDGLGHGAARRALAAARNLRGAGSLTVIATARAPLGGETTTIALLPGGAVDEAASGTLRAELLGAAAAKPVRVRKPRAPRKPKVSEETAEEAAEDA
ncbi:MAG TPA: Rho termination factor N-terminal domain-containing protein [Solirubrobacteraceae bacterium]|jgi:transcription termination factor Rho